MFVIPIDQNTVMFAALGFSAGMIAVILYNKIRQLLNVRGEDPFREDGSIVEAVVSEYSRRLGVYEKALADLLVRMDVLEKGFSRTSSTIEEKRDVVPEISHQYHASQTSPQVQYHADRVSDTVTITQRPQHHAEQYASSIPVPSYSQSQEDTNGTTEYILKMLSERPRTSREIQHALGRTREHTSRLMKRMFEVGFVARDGNSKPFRYSVTEAGRRQLASSRRGPFVATANMAEQGEPVQREQNVQPS